MTDAAGGRGFAGFPASGLATAVPNLFFGLVLPQIERPEELVVSIYFFFAQQQQAPRTPRFVTRRELAAEGTLLRALARVCGGRDHEALEEGLRLAVQRGTLTRAVLDVAGREEEVFAVNTPVNRRGLAELAAARVHVEEPLPPAEGTAAPNIYAVYEENIGPITPLIADHLKDAEETYPLGWIMEAIDEAVSRNKRSWRYVATILRRWETEGRSNEKPGRDTQAEWLALRYAAGKGGRPGGRRTRA